MQPYMRYMILYSQRRQKIIFLLLSVARQMTFQPQLLGHLCSHCKQMGADNGGLRPPQLQRIQE